MRKLTTLLTFLLTGHHHHWGVPHPDKDGRLVQTCYGCTKDRVMLVDLRPGA